MLDHNDVSEILRAWNQTCYIFLRLACTHRRRITSLLEHTNRGCNQISPQKRHSVVGWRWRTAVRSPSAPLHRIAFAPLVSICRPLCRLSYGFWVHTDRKPSLLTVSLEESRGDIPESWCCLIKNHHISNEGRHFNDIRKMLGYSTTYPVHMLI